VNKIRPFLKKTPGSLRIGDKVTFLVIHSTGTAKSVIINNRYSGILPVDIHMRELRKGYKSSGYIQDITPENKIEISLYPVYRSSKNNLQEDILKMVKGNNGFLPYNDRSSQQDINKVFRMSKKTFKKVIGNLYKSKSITIDDHGIRTI
jgi:predicted RNA-binding protein (virulence factor B family)